MNNQQIIKTLQESARVLKVDLHIEPLHAIDRIPRNYENTELTEFIRDLVEAGGDAGLILLEKHLVDGRFKEFMMTFKSPVIVFVRGEEGRIEPVLIVNKRKYYETTIIKPDLVEQKRVKTLHELDMACTEQLEVIFLSVFDYQSLVSDQLTKGDKGKTLSPVKRLYRLLAAEKKDILYVYVYAVLIGLLSLSLPLGIQAAVELISGGVIVTSVYVLIAFVIFGVLGTGVLQVFQITIVEYLQRRVFTKAAFEFAFRVPRINMEAVLDLHMPELMNRFFDVITLQKGLPKLLIDLSTGVIQILFGLILLSLYHPFFVLFGAVLLTILFLIFYLTGPKGLQSSIVESKYKYKVVYWLEEMARTLYSFKLSGNTSLPTKKTDYNVNNYLKNRNVHFNVLVSQYTYVLLFKTVVTGGVLIIGTILVVGREITLGQFVAAEVIIILILASVEKIIMYMDVVYDMLTAVDKISHVTDLPLEPTGGIDIPREDIEKNGLSIEINKLNYRYHGENHNSLHNINLKITAGERICISGPESSGKTTLTNVIAGIHTEYDGIITYNKYNLKDLDRTNLRDKIAKNVKMDDIFEGTVLENVLVGKPFATIETALKSIEEAGLTDDVYKLKDGLNTSILSGGKGYSSSFINRLILARCLAKKPSLLILNDFFNNFQKPERLQLIEMLTNKEKTWTLITVSNDPLIMAASDRVLYIDNGKITEDGPFEEIIKNQNIIKNIY